MSLINRPNRVVLTSFADTNIHSNNVGGNFWSFTNNLQTPLLNVSEIQLLSASFVNPALQLNDYSQLMFFYYASTTATGINVLANLRCVRLVPSWYIPVTGFTAYTPNQYFNDGSALVSQLNLAAATGGDSVTYNPLWVAGDITFSFNTNTRRISFTGNTSSTYYTPAAQNDPVVLDYLATNAIKLHSNTGTGTTDLVQPYKLNVTMNPSLGFAMRFYNTGRNWGTGSYQGCACQLGYPQANTVAIVGDSFPILLGIENVKIYCSVVTGSGIDSGQKKNFMANVPIQNYGLCVNTFTLTSTNTPALRVGDEINTITFEFRDDHGNEVWFYENMAVTLELSIKYNQNILRKLE